MKRCKTNGLCCGAGGAQMFKEPEKKAIKTSISKEQKKLWLCKPNVVTTGCPFCNTMMTDGVKNFNKK